LRRPPIARAPKFDRLRTVGVLHALLMIRRFGSAAAESPNNLEDRGIVAFLRVLYTGVLIAGVLGALGIAPGFDAHLVVSMLLLTTAGFAFLRLLIAIR
jgi:hypothetical protein